MELYTKGSYLMASLWLLKKTHDDAQEFVDEVASIRRTSHVNIVNLLGFCYERNNKALVYEFMPSKLYTYQVM